MDNDFGLVDNMTDLQRVRIFGRYQNASGHDEGHYWIWAKAISRTERFPYSFVAVLWDDGLTTAETFGNFFLANVNNFYSFFRIVMTVLEADSDVCGVCYDVSPGTMMFKPHHCRHEVCSRCLLGMMRVGKMRCPFCKSQYRSKTALPDAEDIVLDDEIENSE